LQSPATVADTILARCFDNDAAPNVATSPASSVEGVQIPIEFMLGVRRAGMLPVVVAGDEFKRRSRYDWVGIDQLQSGSIGVSYSGRARGKALL
jgi:hypothetical protein